MEGSLTNGSESGRRKNLRNWIQTTGVKVLYNYHIDTWDHVYFFILAEILLLKTVLLPTQAPGLGHQPGDYTPGEKKYTTSDYIIPPKVS
jgi:hypothetical protein